MAVIGLVIFMSEKELSIVINGNYIEINGFVTCFVKETIIGRLSSLKLEENQKLLRLKLIMDNYICIGAVLWLIK